MKEFENFPADIHPANYEMKRKEKPVVPTGERFDAATLASLSTMPKEALISLIERMARQCGLVAMMTEDDIRQAFLDRMAHIGLTGKAAESLAAMEKRMDRIEGRPMQRVDTRNLHAYTLMPTVTRNGKEVTFNVGKPVTLDLEATKI